MFSLVGVGERAGSGIPDLMSTWRKYVKYSPEYSIKQNPARTECVFPFTIQALQEAGRVLAEEKSGLNVDQSGLSEVESGPKVDQSELSATAQAILKLLNENPSMTYNEISAHLGKARSGIAKHIKNLREKGLLNKRKRNLRLNNEHKKSK